MELGSYRTRTNTFSHPLLNTKWMLFAPMSCAAIYQTSVSQRLPDVEHVIIKEEQNIDTTGRLLVLFGDIGILLELKWNDMHRWTCVILASSASYITTKYHGKVIGIICKSHRFSWPGTWSNACNWLHPPLLGATKSVSYYIRQQLRFRFSWEL